MSSPYLPLRHRPALPAGWSPEAWRLMTALLAFVVGAVATAVAYGTDDGMGLWGLGSLGEVTAVAAGGTGTVIFAVWYVWANKMAVNRWRRRLHPVRRVADVVGLSLVHASIALLALSAIFWVSSQAFRELQLDRISAAGVAGAAVAVAAYLITGSALQLTTRSLSELLALFVISGALSSMLTASDPLWWHQHLSQLGAASDASGITFNLTLILGGLVITTVADFITHDLASWARGSGVAAWRVEVVRVVIVITGLLLAGLAFLPVDRFFLAHNIVAFTMFGVFAALVAAVPLLFRSLSRSLALVCVATIGLLGLGFVMFWILHYLNLTAFELIIIAGVFGWLVIFISSVDTAAAQLITRRGDVVLTAAGRDERDADVRDRHTAVSEEASAALEPALASHAAPVPPWWAGPIGRDEEAAPPRRAVGPPSDQPRRALTER